MRITIITLGTRGDVQPFVALALGLQQAGHSVTLASTIDYEAFINSYGLKFWPIQVHFRHWMKTDAGRAVMDPGQNIVHSLRQLNYIAQSIIERCLVDSWAACENAEAVIYGAVALLLTMAHIQPVLNIPCFQVKMQPGLYPTGAFPPPAAPLIPKRLANGFWPLRLYNRLMYRVLEQLFWQPLRPQINRWRQNSLNLRPLPWRGPYQAYYQQRLPGLYGYSPRLIPRPNDWPDWHYVTGFWYLDAPPGWQPPPDLVDFLDAGPPPLAVSFGSTLFQNGEQVRETIVQAITETGHRAIFISGWGGLGLEHLPDNAFACRSVPYDWLLPKVKAIIHHGGAGTTAAALRAGIPSVTIPVFADHPFWARRLAELKLGSKPIPRSRLTRDRLVGAIKAATEDGGLSDNAAQFRPLIQAETGVQNAVNIIQHYLARG